MSASRLKLVFFCPTKNTRNILDNLFQKFPSVLGRIGNYDEAAFITRGTGQFRPSKDAKPAIGSVGQLEFVEEDRVELVINGQKEQIRDAIKELKNLHPYEEVAYDVYKLEDF